MSTIGQQLVTSFTGSMFMSRHSERGFTLIEMLVVVTLMGILLLIASPRLSELSASFDRMNAKAYLIQDLKRAQAEAITEGCRGVFAIDSDMKGYTFGCDYLAYDTNVPPAADSVTFRRNLPSTIRITSSTPIIFDSRGHAVDAYNTLNNVTITLSNSSGVSFSSGLLLGTGVFNYA